MMWQELTLSRILPARDLLRSQLDAPAAAACPAAAPLLLVLLLSLLLVLLPSPLLLLLLLLPVSQARAQMVRAGDAWG